MITSIITHSILIVSSLSFALSACPQRQTINSKETPSISTPQEEKIKIEVLSTHKTIAQFEGITDHICHGMTALCPDRCGHSGKMATFKIIKYTDYQKKDEYGDPPQQEFCVLLKDTPQWAETIQSLTPKDQVYLNWDHLYVTKGGMSSPERPITCLKKIKTADKS